MKTLKLGDKNSDVKYLQQILHLAVDGVFGKNTLEAVKQFQLNNNLVADGVVGTNTWRVLQQVSPQSKRYIKELILHCTATQEGQEVTTAQIDKWHKAQGWAEIGYHYVIYLDGTVHKGRDEQKAGAHCEGHNSNSIGISYVGGVDKHNKPKDTRTKAQKLAMYKLVQQLLKKYNLTIDNVYCHNNYTNAKACPSFAIKDFRKEYKDYFK